MQDTFTNDLSVVTLNVDLTGDSTWTPELGQAIRSIIEKDSRGTEHLAIVESSVEFFQGYEIYSLPAALLFGSDGTLIEKFEGEFSYHDHVTKRIKRELASR